MTLTIAFTLALALSSQAQRPAAGSAIQAPPVVSAPNQAQPPAQPADPKPAGTTGVIISPQPAPAPQSISRASEANVLLERIELLLSRTESENGDLKSAGKVTLNRADVAEIVAELKQLKVMLAGQDR